MMRKIQIAILHNMPEADDTLSGVRGVKKHNIPVFLQMPLPGWRNLGPVGPIIQIVWAYRHPVEKFLAWGGAKGTL